ncbi:hypothetical protein GIB67_012402, partial [Kingdonia uniflora]
IEPRQQEFLISLSSLPHPNQLHLHLHSPVSSNRRGNEELNIKFFFFNVYNNLFF